MKKSAVNLLAEIVNTRELSRAQEIVRELEQKHDFAWRPVGDREANYGNIAMGSDPGHAFVERVTNAIDAVIEREAIRSAKKGGKGKRLPRVPRDAVEDWFRVPGGRVSSLPAQLKKDEKKGVSRQDLADEIVIRVFDSASKKEPTVEVRDFGVGLTPADVPRTILSLNAENKITKPYLAGAYGQGGSTALAFSPLGCMIVSRRQKDLLEPGESDTVAITFVRYNELDAAKNKNGRFEYLVLPSREVAGVEASEIPDFDSGTSVVHFQLAIPRYSARITQLTGSLWWLLQNSLFDPVLPFWVEERRRSMLEQSKEVDRRTIAGNFTRLMDDKKERIEHADSADVSLSYAGDETLLKVNYWVVKPPKDGDGDAIATYVDPYRPIAFTFNGQTHGTEDRRFTRERLSLPYLANFLIVQVELDHLSPPARRALLSTTRDRLKKLPFYDEIMEAVANALGEDENLAALDDARKERLLSKHSEAEREKMRQRFARLMERFKAGVDTSASGKGTSSHGRKAAPPGTRQHLAALPTKEEPSFIRIGNAQKPILVQLDRQVLIRLESDAPDGYLLANRSAKLTIASEPEDVLTLVSKSDFSRGRSRLTVKPTLKAKVGDEGSISVFLFKPNGKPLPAKVGFKVIAPNEHQTAGHEGKSKVHVPEPIPVRRDEWPEHKWDESSVAKVNDDGKDIEIFVNIDNKHLVRLLETGGYQEVGITRMRNNFLLYVAFYAWAKHSAEQGKENALSGKDFEEYERAELDRAAQTVCHAISSVSRMEEED